MQLHIQSYIYYKCDLNKHFYRVPEDIYDNGGDWLFGIYPVGRDFNSQNLIGFVHAEDHFYDPETGFPGWKAYKSIALGNTSQTV